MVRNQRAQVISIRSLSQYLIPPLSRQSSSSTENSRLAPRHSRIYSSHETSPCLSSPFPLTKNTSMIPRLVFMWTAIISRARKTMSLIGADLSISSSSSNPNRRVRSINSVRVVSWVELHAVMHASRLLYMPTSVLERSDSNMSSSPTTVPVSPTSSR